MKTDDQNGRRHGCSYSRREEQARCGCVVTLATVFDIIDILTSTTGNLGGAGGFWATRFQTEKGSVGDET